MLILFWSLLISRVGEGEPGCWKGSSGGNIDQFCKIISLKTGDHWPMGPRLPTQASQTWTIFIVRKVSAINKSLIFDVAIVANTLYCWRISWLKSVLDRCIVFCPGCLLPAGFNQEYLSRYSLKIGFTPHRAAQWTLPHCSRRGDNISRYLNTSHKQAHPVQR